MALSKSISTQYGVDATYWTITRFTIDRVSFSCEIQIAGYANQQAESEKKSPITQKTFNVNFSEDPKVIENIFEGYIQPQAITPELIGLFQSISQFGYGLVKLSSEFSESENI